MNNLDLRPYAERLAEAMPERWVFKHDNEGYWYLPTLNPEFPGTEFYAELDADSPEAQQWSFFGSLLDEFKCDPILWLGAWHGKSQTMTWLEAVAEAVCQSAEAKAKESQ